MAEHRPVLSLTLHLFGEPGLPDARHDEAWAQCHGPLLDALEALSRLKVGLVLGGDLLPHWEERHPDRLERVRALVRAGRVELVATPLYEPVLSSVPERDATGQLLAHVLLVKRIFEVRPQGTWLPYRVWDPGTPRVVDRAELGWCLVDDLAIARLHPGRPDPWGVWWTERGGHAIRLLGADARALEMSGEVPVRDLLVYARGRAVQGATVQFWALPSHRFGLRKRRDPKADADWLRQFLEGLEAAAHLDLDLPSAAALRAPARGRTYLPSCSPPERDHPWERHFVDHPEADRLHKKMLRVSRQLARLEKEAEIGEVKADPDAVVQATRYLYRAQGADALRPGDDPVRRARAWRDLVRAEREILQLRGAADRPVCELVDLDTSGRRQVLLRTQDLCVVADPERGAGVTELAAYGVAANLVDPYTLREVDRRPRLAFVEHVLRGDEDAAESPEAHAEWDVLSTERSEDGTVRTTFARVDDALRLSLVKSYALRSGPRLDWSLELANRGPEPLRFRLVLDVVLALPAPSESPVGEVADVRLAGTGLSLALGLRRPARVSLVPHRSPAPAGEPYDQGVRVLFDWTVELLPAERDRLGLALEVEG